MLVQVLGCRMGNAVEVTVEATADSFIVQEKGGLALC